MVRYRITTWAYDMKKGVNTSITFSDGTPTQQFTWNHLNQLTQVVDTAGTRSIAYNEYAEPLSENLSANGKTHLITQQYDSLGRNSGYTYAKAGAIQQTVSTTYAPNGRIATAGFLHGGVEKLFTYGYMEGSLLLETLTMPNGMTLSKSYEAHRGE